MKIRGMKKFNEVNGYEKFKVKIRGAKKSLRGTKISMENLRGMQNFHHFPKNTPTGYPDLKKAGP